MGLCKSVMGMKSVVGVTMPVWPKDPTKGRYSMITAQWLQRSQRVAPRCVGVRLEAALRIAALNPVTATGHPWLR